MDPHSAFSNRPFVAGSLTGLRAFRVTSDAHLTGVFVDTYQLSPGVNEARCAASGVVQSMNRMNARVRYVSGLGPKVPATEHELVGLGCRCGFYAYFDGKNDHLWGSRFDGYPRVAAIVEGFGRCVVGDRGFRAEKLRLVALVRPVEPEGPGRIRRAVDALAAWSIRKPWRSPVLLLAGCLIIALPVSVALTSWVQFVAALASGGLWGTAVNRLHRHGWRLRMEQRVREALGLTTLSVDWDALLANYPGVPVYAAAAEAMAAHPLTPPAPEERSAPKTPYSDLSSHFVLPPGSSIGFAPGGFVRPQAIPPQPKADS